MGIIKNFLNSEKAIASGVLVIASSLMTIAGKLTPQEWMDYTQTLLGIYVGGKTVQGAVAALAGRNPAGDTAKAKDLAAGATSGLDELTRKIKDNDAAADSAIDDKFHDEELDLPEIVKK